MVKMATRTHSGACVNKPQTRLTADYRDGWLSIETADPTGNHTSQLLVAFPDAAHAARLVQAIEEASKEN